MTDTRHLHEVGTMGFDVDTYLEVLASDDTVHVAVFPRPWSAWGGPLPSAVLDMPPKQARQLAGWLTRAAELAEQRQQGQP